MRQIKTEIALGSGTSKGQTFIGVINALNRLSVKVKTVAKCSVEASAVAVIFIDRLAIFEHWIRNFEQNKAICIMHFFLHRQHAFVCVRQFIADYSIWHYVRRFNAQYNIQCWHIEIRNHFNRWQIMPDTMVIMSTPLQLQKDRIKQIYRVGAPFGQVLQPVYLQIAMLDIYRDKEAIIARKGAMKKKWKSYYFRFVTMCKHVYLSNFKPVQTGKLSAFVPLYKLLQA